MASAFDEYDPSELVDGQLGRDALHDTAALRGEVSHAGAQEKQKLPQLDVETFSSQIFWLALCFTLFYIMVSRSVLPRIHEVVDKRRARIESDLDRAERLASEARHAQEAYESLHRKAQQDASSLVTNATTAIAREQEEAFAKVDRQVVTMLSDNELALAERRAKLLEEMLPAARSIAAGVVAELTSASVDERDVEKYVSTPSRS